MAYGITTEGFVAKRLVTIKSEVEATLRATFGSGINLDSRGPFGQLVGIFSEREALLWELAEQVYNSQYPQTAAGVGVDNTLDLVGLKRKSATASVAILKLFGVVGTTIPAGSQVSKDGEPSVVFQTSEAGTILAGTGVDEEQKITFSSVPTSGSWELEYDGQVTSTLAYNISAATLQTELENLSNIGAGNITVTGNFTSGFTLAFTGSLAETPVEQVTVSANTLLDGINAVTATPTTLTPGVLPNVEVEAFSTVTGAIAAPSTTLSTIETPVTGWDSVTNELDAEIGQNLESDADAKVRRAQSLAIPGHSTLNAIYAELLQISGVVAARIFENTAMIEVDGRPAKSYEAIVQGGEDEDIAEVLLETKPLGIQQVGDESVTLKDSQGFDKIVKFSRPTEIPIYLEVEITAGADYPLNGDDLVEEALLAFGEGLNIGEDVIIVPALVCSLEAIPGIKGAAVKIATVAIHADGSNAVTFSNESTNLRVNYTGHTLENEDRVKFTTTGTLPSGLTAGVTYFVRNKAADKFFLSETRTGDLIPFVSSGSGTHTVTFGGLDENIDIEESERADFDSSRITVTS